MLLGFKVRFAPHIQDGSKTHTIRAKRKLRPKPGEVCHCYTGLRQKGARLLGRWRCVRVQDIRIDRVGIWVDGVMLSDDERDQLAWRDGFRPVGSTYDRPGRAFELMIRYWLTDRKKGDKKPLPFKGDLIHWDYAQPVEKKVKRAA